MQTPDIQAIGHIMTNIYCYVDDCDIHHWILWDPDSRDNGGRELLEDAMKTGFPIQTFLENQDNTTLEDLSNFLFCRYHDDDDFNKFLLNNIAGDMSTFVTFLTDNLTEKDLSDMSDRLAGLKKEKILAPTS